jgi:3-isopropylmalate/(R)-2-methylmalate dehydratase small subunit
MKTSQIKGRVCKLVVSKNKVHSKEVVPDYYSSVTHGSLSENLFADISPGFSDQIFFSTILVVGDQFSFGSTREEPVLAIKEAGFRVVIANSFSRSFYYNAFNHGLLCLECDVSQIDDEDEISVDYKFNLLRNISKQIGLKISKVPSFCLELYENGGLINILKNNKDYTVSSNENDETSLNQLNFY